MGSFSFFSSTLLLVFSLICLHENQVRAVIFNVKQYGALSDGITDNIKAFSSAFNQACQTQGRNVILVPQGTYLLGPLQVNGPCKGPLVFQVNGVLRARTDQSSINYDHWISFRHIFGLVINGGGRFEAEGPSAWPYNNCRNQAGCRPLPATIRLDFVNKALVHHVNFINSKGVHINIFGSNNIFIHHINIQAPDDSPNTDGIHIGNSQQIRIFSSKISTGDDCVSLSGGSQYVNVTSVHCGPGHGISIGSLGKLPNEENVNGVLVQNSVFTGTTNGVRIKTWALSHPLLVSNIMFQGIFFRNVDNPIIIDQEYCPMGHCQPWVGSQVQIKGVTYDNLWGVSNTKVAVNLLCSPSKPCENIVMKNININYKGGGGSTSSCRKAYGSTYGKQIPACCLK